MGSFENMPSQQKTLKSGGARLDEALVTKVLDRLDQARNQSSEAQHRADERYSYRRVCAIELTQPSGNVMSFKAPTRDLSRGGLAFVHYGFIHVGTKCRVQLVTTHNSWQHIEGKVVRCEYVDGGIHLVGVKFKFPIDITTFCGNATPKRVLLVDDDACMRKLVAMHLKSLNVEISEAEDGEAAITSAGSNVYDVILMDIEMPKLDGVAAIKKMREKGYGGSVIAVTARTTEGDREQLLQAGFDRYLPKPVTKAALVNALAEIEEEPLFSTMIEEEGMEELINHFVDELATIVPELEKASAQADLEALVRISRNLKGQAGSFGFEPISELAQAVETLALAKSPPGAMVKSIRDLIRMCRMTRKTS